jgi:hypothetical protein
VERILARGDCSPRLGLPICLRPSAIVFFKTARVPLLDELFKQLSQEVKSVPVMALNGLD